MPWPNVTVVHANSFIVNAFSKGMTISAFSMLGIETSKEKEERGSPDHGRRVANSGQPYAGFAAMTTKAVLLLLLVLSRAATLVGCV